MTENGFPSSYGKKEAWRAEVARGYEVARANEEKSKRLSLSPRPTAGEPATETEGTVPVEDPNQPSLGNHPAPTVRESDSMPS